MFCRVMSAAISGVEAVPVAVEADAGSGLPVFSIVGYVSSQVREAEDRVRTALRHYEISLPPQRLTINLAPGDLRKDGTRFDLPIAASVLGAIGEVNPSFFKDKVIIGELRLDGTADRINGVLPSVLCAKKCGCRTCIVPAGNYEEARLVDGIEAIGIRDIGELIRLAKGEMLPEPIRKPDGRSTEENEAGVSDFADIRGQKAVKRAAVIAAAGFHNLLLSGPPGAGKSMTAERIPSILPSLTKKEQLEISKLYSIAGLLPEDTPLLKHRPFRCPHHSVTPAALCGGGKYPKPGEVTLAHRGVLFLDEIAEIKRETLELLRQPLEEHHVTISRVGGTFDFPAGFLLIAAMNPCPCGYFPDRSRCRCTVSEINLYRRKISHAFMDRIDLFCEVKAVPYAALASESDTPEDTPAGSDPSACAGEEAYGGGDYSSSEKMQQLVNRAVRIQAERYEKTGIRFNSELSASDIRRFCSVTDDGNRMLHMAFDSLGLSARGYHHILKVARTIADLDGSEIICEAHVSEAIACRNGD